MTAGTAPTGLSDGSDGSNGPDGPGLVDARALWWRAAGLHALEQGGTGWDFGPVRVVRTIVLAGHRYVSDARVLIREDRLSGWPGPRHPHYPRPCPINIRRHNPFVITMTTLMATPEACPPADDSHAGAPARWQFDPGLLDPITAAGYDVRALAASDVDPALDPALAPAHAVVGPDGLRIGLLMPILPQRDLADQAAGVA